MTGPDQDYVGDKKGRFMIASIYRDNATVENEFAWLRSPLYKSSEHPVECFNFWFNFGVRYTKNFLSFDVTNLLQQGQNEYLTVSVEHEGENPKVIWSLDQNWNTTQKWHEARVEVTPIEAAANPEYRVSKLILAVGNFH